MVPCHSCHINGICRIKALKSSFGVAMQATRGDDFFKGKLVSIM